MKGIHRIKKIQKKKKSRNVFLRKGKLALRKLEPDLKKKLNRAWDFIMANKLFAAIVLVVLIGVPLVLILTSGGAKSVAVKNAGISPVAATANIPSPGASSVASATPSSTPSAAPTPANTFVALKKGMTSPEVAKLQKALMDLDYMDDDMPTNLFGPVTDTALRLFQQKHNLKQDGVYTQSLANLLASDLAQKKKYKVSVGDTGDDVKQIKQRLNDLGYLPDSEVTKANVRTFNNATKTAVMEFQSKNKDEDGDPLDKDGKVGAITKEALFADDATPFFNSIGTSGPDVLKLQKRLQELHYLNGTPDGTFGQDTQDAVKLFQDKNGLIVDGYVGPETKKLLFSNKAEPNAMTIGANGSDVQKLQKKLIALKYLKGSADGYYGVNTESAVKAFQKKNKLNADGRAGDQTINLLLNNNPRKPVANTGGKIINTRQKRVNSLIAVAKSKIGKHYIRGAKGPNAFDCSGFVYWCLNKIGVRQSYMTSGGWAGTHKYQRISSIGALKAGDIISFKGHVGIALGGGRMIDCAPSGNGVRMTSLSHPYWRSHFIRGYRVL